MHHPRRQVAFPPNFSTQEIHRVRELKVCLDGNRCIIRRFSSPSLRRSNPTDKGSATELRYARSNICWCARVTVSLGVLLLAVSVRLGRFWDGDTRRSMGDTPIVGTGREENVDRKITPRTIIAVTSLELYITRNDCVGSLLRLFRGY